MKIYLPFNRFMMYSLFSLPIVIGPVMFVAVTKNMEPIMLAIVFLVALFNIVWITVILQYTRKDGIILDENHLQYGTKEAQVKFLKVISNKYERNKIHLNELTAASFNKETTSIVISTEFKKIHLNVKGFPIGHINELLQKINQRIESNHG